MIKVFIKDGFSTVEHGSFGPGEMEMSEELVKKYAVFVEILDDKAGGLTPPATIKTDIKAGAKKVGKTRKRKV